MRNSSQSAFGITKIILLQAAALVAWAFPVAAALAEEAESEGIVSIQRPNAGTEWGAQEGGDLTKVRPLPMPSLDSVQPSEIPEDLKAGEPASSDSRAPDRSEW